MALWLGFLAAAFPAAGASQVLGTPVPTGHSLGSDSAAIVSAVDAYHRALANGDSVTVTHLLAPDAVVLENGGAESLAEYLSHHLPSDIAFAQAIHRERGPIRVVVRDDVAWATSTSTTRGEYRGRTINSTGAELMVLIRMEDGWKISAIHWSSRTLPS